ncbi:hypothetical protein CARUB_v10005957mg [Capsella rubella]|uniref:Uncharacterized protein n=1 Tax=Capsella rubella TaxID=81985 RepID=R0GZ69_9BRAS|nr:uncharacterized protein LOC17878541 [Capsella rubella]XP_023635124.1 uncharacterized protein LOC17878541 [Capsella rubella]XP_023635125.1 uncharacterized protein LOC17878541 [Capsella rubella]EOA17595.1 hypothetical protein CARUB_v10005957mg [Capsella rubella]
MSSRWDQSEKRCNNKNNNKSSDTVPIAEYKILKEKYENMVKENESLIQALELLEIKHGVTVDDLVKKPKQALGRKEEVAKWGNKLDEMQKKLETVEKNVEFLLAVDDDMEMIGMASGSGAGPAKKPKVENSVSKEDVIMLSDDEDGNQR